MSMHWNDLEAALIKAFTDGVKWPPDAASLSALRDIGLTVNDVARYFGVTPDEIREAFEQLSGPIPK